MLIPASPAQFSKASHISAGEPPPAPRWRQSCCIRTARTIVWDSSGAAALTLRSPNTCVTSSPVSAPSRCSIWTDRVWSNLPNAGPDLPTASHPASPSGIAVVKLPADFHRNHCECPHIQELRSCPPASTILHISLRDPLRKRFFRATTSLTTSSMYAGPDFDSACAGSFRQTDFVACSVEKFSMERVSFAQAKTQLSFSARSVWEFSTLP